jgi:hypothetical protein
MNAEAILSALRLPEGTRVGQRVPKKLLLEQGKPSAADKRMIQDAVSELIWVAALKPANTGVPSYGDGIREYLEIAVLSLTLKTAARATRLDELIHRAIPYPVVLVTSHGTETTISLAHKRLSQSEAGSVVLEAAPTCATISDEGSPSIVGDLLSALSLAKQPRADLLGLYRGWISQVEAYLAALITGSFSPAKDDPATIARHDALADHERLRREITALRAQAAKEKQVSRRVELNLTIQRLEAELARTTSQL